jgi:hypothetical protein
MTPESTPRSAPHPDGFPGPSAVRITGGRAIGATPALLSLADPEAAGDPEEESALQAPDGMARQAGRA